MTQHEKPSQRVERMTEVALTLAAKHGYTKVTREQIAQRLGVAPSLVSHHMGTMKALRRTLVRHAVQREVLPVIAQALAARDTHAVGIPEALKARALATLAG